MTHASLFSGIGGPEVAAAMLGWRNAFHCDINPFGRAVLEYWFPNSKSYGDIKKTNFTEWEGAIDVLTGGFPCQPFSYAGKRKGADDDRYLWPEFKRVIAEIRPTWVIGENVAGIVSMVEPGEVTQMASQATLFDEGDGVRGYRYEQPFTIERVCSDLEGLGYSVQPILIPACAVGAPHRRDRVFIIARDVAANANIGANGGVAREDEGEGREERIQERHEVRKPNKPNQVRPEGATIPEDSMHGGQLHRPNEEQGSERNERNTCAGGGERICGETSRTTSADTMLRGSVSSRPSEASEGNGIDELSQSDGQGQRFAPCGDSRLSRLSRNAPDPDSHRGREVDEHMESQLADGAKPVSNGGQRNVADTDNMHLQAGSTIDGRSGEDREGWSAGNCRYPGLQGCEGDWCGQRWGNFPSVSPVHRGNDGLPFRMDRASIPFGKWRTEALKAYGNAIVPQVMYEIFRAIEMVENEKNITNALTLCQLFV